MIKEEMEEGEGLPVPEENSNNSQNRVRLFGHRGGSWEAEERGRKENIAAQNSWERITRGLKSLGGVEADVRLTKDGVPVLVHRSVKGMSLAQFKKKYPNHGTLEGLVDWFARRKGGEVYLDLKDAGEIDAWSLIELVAKLEGRVIIGAKDPQAVAKLLLARKLLGKEREVKIFLQIPDPAVPKKAVEYAKHLVRNAGWREENLTKEEWKMVKDLQPDGVHFFFPENLLKDLVAEIVGHGAWVPVGEKLRNSRAVVLPFPNIPLFHDLQRRRLKKFVEEALRAGYRVIAGSAAGKEINQRMIEWGVMAIMPNIPDYLPPEVVAQLKEKQTKDKAEKIQPPSREERFRATISFRRKEPTEKGLEEGDSDSPRDKYLQLVRKMGKGVGPIRQQIGI